MTGGGAGKGRGDRPADVRPFDPPVDYEFEAEFQGDPPRPRTIELSRGRHAVRRRKLISGCLIAAAVFTALAPWAFVQECALYIVPLQYLYWIGLGLGLAAIAQFFFDRIFSGPYRYVEKGQPLIARIRSVELRVTHKIHETSVYRFFAMLEYRHPESGELRLAEVMTRQISQLEVWSGLTTSYRVGDYVTAVYFPGELEKSLRLYGFLELKPGLGLIDVQGSRVWTWGYVCFLIFVSTVPPFALLWFLYIVSKFWPLDVDPFQAITAFVTGGVVLGGAFLAWRNFKTSRVQASLGESSTTAGTGRSLGSRLLKGGFSLIFAFLLGGMTLICVCCAINAGFDRSQPSLRPVQIDGMVSVTHHGFLREYKIQYHFLDGAREHEDIVSTPREMAQFRGDRARAEVYAGFFGWPWVKGIHPSAK